MISIKKYLDDKLRTKVGDVLEPCRAIETVYRSGLLHLAKAVARDESPYGAELSARLFELDKRMGPDPSIADIKQAASEFEANLSLWSKWAALERRAMAFELKQLIKALAETADAVASRGQEHSDEFGALTGHLEQIATLENIAEIRVAIVNRVSEFRSGINQLKQTNRELVSDLQTKVTKFEERLKSVEELAFIDPLTGVANRRSLEERIAYNIEHQSTFCVVLFDLNRFKDVNDTFGHVAGDDLLRQFGEKLKIHSRGTDTVGRWGGDEFVLVLSGTEKAMDPAVRRLQRQVCSRYLLRGSGEFYSTLDVEAAVGMAQWRPGESLTEVVARADENMYRDKSRLKKASVPQAVVS